MRYSKTTAHAIVIEIAELGGIGMMDLYMEQGILNMQILFKALSVNGNGT